jgi:hypothetical protein
MPKSSPIVFAIRFILSDSMSFRFSAAKVLQKMLEKVKGKVFTNFFKTRTLIIRRLEVGFTNFCGRKKAV